MVSKIQIYDILLLSGDGERYSFDSDGFDEESICSWISEPESLCNVWRGWTWKNNSKQYSYHNQHQANGKQATNLSNIWLALRKLFENLVYTDSIRPLQLVGIA